MAKKTFKVSGLVDVGAISRERPTDALPKFDRRTDSPAPTEQHVDNALLIPIDQISPNPYQPRTVFPAKEMEELAVSISEIGLIQPITVRKLEEARFQLVAGERRWRAFKLLEKAEIPATVVDCDDEDMAIMAISENVDRTDLSDYEICKAIRKIETLFPNRTRLAKALGMIREHLYRYLAFEAMPTFLIERLDSNPSLISKFTAVEIKRVLNGTEAQDLDKVESILREAVDLIEKGDLDQTKIAAHIQASMKAQTSALYPSKEIYPIHNEGNHVGFLQISPNGVTAKIKAGVISREKSLALQKLISDFISENST